MNKFMKVFWVSLLFSVLIFNSTYGTENKVAKVVDVTDIDVPYTNSRTLDTEGNVTKDSRCRITKIAWKTPSQTVSGLYEVTVSLQASVGYVFSGDTVATINGEVVVKSALAEGEEDKMDITYAFPKSVVDSSSRISNTLRYRINLFYNSDYGTIEPFMPRPLAGSNQTITITPKSGYKIKEVSIDGTSVGVVTEYTFKKIKDDHTVRAWFEEVEEEKDETAGPLLSFLINLIKSL